MQRLGVDPFGLPTARRPFRNNPDRAPEAKYLEATPQVGAVAMTGGPLGVEPWQVMFERTLPNPEYIRSLTSQHPADEATTMSSKAHDLLDGSARLGRL